MCSTRFSGTISVVPAAAMRGSSARPGSDVEDELDIFGADALDHVAIIAKLHRRLAAIRLAHVNMHDSSAGFCRAETGVGDLLGGDWQMRRLLRRRQIAGDGAGDENLVAGFTHHGAFRGICRHRPQWSCRLRM
jgi:hypothetical protein